MVARHTPVYLLEALIRWRETKVINLLSLRTRVDNSALAGMVTGNRPHQLSTSYTNLYQILRMITTSNPSMFNNMGSQNWVHHDLANVSNLRAQQFGVHSGSFHQSTSHQFNSYQHQSLAPQSMLHT